MLLPALAVTLAPSLAHALADEVTLNIPYRSGPSLDANARERCQLDLLIPKSKKEFATVVWFHGGGLTGGAKGIPDELRGKGVAVAAAGYRLSPSVKSPTYLQDAAAAVGWVARNIRNYGGSERRIFVSGHSAGGYLALMLGLDKSWLRAEKVDADSLAGLIPFSGQCITHFTVRKERGIPETRPTIDPMAPLFFVRKDCPPLWLITGDREEELLGRYEENAYLWRMMKLVGHLDVKLTELQGYNHGEMAGPAFPLLLRFVAEQSKKSR